MKNLDSLVDVIQLIQKYHHQLRRPTAGAIAYKFIRKPDGRRIAFEYSKGFKIFNFKVPDSSTLVIEQLSSGYEFKGSYKHVMSSMLYLTDLSVINIYEHQADFYSWNSIDFSYVENIGEVNIKMLQDWIHNTNDNLIAQWKSSDDHVDRILEEITVGKKVEFAPPRRRMVDMSGDY